MTKRDSDSCARQPDGLSGLYAFHDIVRHYITHHREPAERELRFYAIQHRLEKVVTLAALARLPSGKRHSHQSSIPAVALEECKERLLKTDLKQCQTFAELHDTVREVIGDIRGIGPLTIYDTALRIGAYLGLEPGKVYLHAGTREGAKSLGFGPRRRYLQLSELPEPFHNLKPREVEDCLCIYKTDLSAI